MLEIMSIVAIVAMVVLLSTIKRLRAVSHDMWVKMVNMEFEIDRLRGLLGPNTVQIGCSVNFEPQQYVKRDKEYVDNIVERACDSLGRCVSKELACYIEPMVIEGIRLGGPKVDYVGEMHFRMPMIRTDFATMTCHIVDKFCSGREFPVVSEIDHRRRMLEEQRSVEHFKDILDSLHVDTKTILQNLES